MLIQAQAESIRKKKNEQRERGECFNVFNILGLTTNETRTHSAFLSELLSPEGTHGCKDAFLKSFLLHIGCLENYEIQTSKATVEVEKNIGNKNEDSTSGGRIDIVITSPTHSIIIENKIYAEDQDKQLYRYNEFAKNHYGLGRYSILYLTLDGHLASDFSTNKQLIANKDYFCISYKKEILAWLQDCIRIAACKPLVRETIVQYENLIKQLTDMNMNPEEVDIMYQTMAQFPEATADIFHNGFDGYLKYVFENFVAPKFTAFCKERNLIYEEHNMWEKKSKGFSFRRKEWKHLVITIYTDKTNYNDFYYGISTFSPEESLENIKKIQHISLANLPQKSNDYWPYGWSYLQKYSSWWSSVTIDMINGKYANYIIKLITDLLDEIDEKNIEMI